MGKNLQKSILISAFLLFLVGNVWGQLSGTYYIGGTLGSVPGGGDPEYATLGEAFTALNTSGVNGACVFYFLDEDYTEATNIALACTGTSAVNTITFKPYTGVTPNIHFTQLADNAGPSGRIVIGSNAIATYTLVTMDYVTIDGSNTIGGTTRDLSITEVNNSVTYQYGIRFVGDVNNIIVKNVVLTIAETGGGSSYGMLVTPRNQSSTDYIPDDIIIDNCEINITGGGACQGISIGASGTLLGPNYPTGIIFRNNKIVARTRGIFLSTGTGNTDIYGNEIYVNQTNGSTLSHGIYAFSVASASRVINIYNNRFMQLQTANSASGDYGILGINIGTQGIYNIYNNMIAGFSTTTITANPNCVVEGIRVSAATANGITTNIYHNTVVIPNLAITPGTGVVIPKGIYVNMSGASGIRNADIRNNLFVSQEPDFLSYSIHWVSTANGSTLASDYNNLAFTTNGKTGLFSATVCDALSDWQTASSQDANSVSKAVNFVDATDLHITGQSIGDYSLAGTPLVLFATDIDGQARSTTFPYKGADENTNVVLASSYKRAMDGDAVDWTGTASGTVHATVVSNEEAIYTGETSDARTDQNGGDGGWTNNDITEFRFTRDDSYLYFMTKFNDVDNLDRPYVAIGLDSDQSDDSPAWIADDSPVSLAPATNRGWERQIAFHATTSGVLDVEMFADDGGSWYAPPSNYAISGSVANNVIEGRISLYDLGINSTSTVKLAVATFNNNAVGYNNVIDGTTGSYIDAVTPGYSGSNNAWFRAGESDNILNENVSFSQNITALPVELTKFDATLVDDGVMLYWSTATEVNNYGFEVEVSTDGENWENVGFVEGHGNSNSQQDYNFLYTEPFNNKVNFRLKQVDTDGGFEYSEVVSVLSGEASFKLNQNYPNPFNPTTIISFSLKASAKVTLKVYNALGQEVAVLANNVMDAGFHEVDFDASNLASGVYIYRLDAPGYSKTMKMMLLK